MEKQKLSNDRFNSCPFDCLHRGSLVLIMQLITPACALPPFVVGSSRRKCACGAFSWSCP
eukprot:1840128-Amphidinium_carterae.1